MSIKPCVLLQGPLYPTSVEGIKQMCKNMNNVIISTWEDENIEYINELKSLGYEMVINKKPIYFGFQNINLANISICSGLSKAKDMGYTHALRFRTDFILNDVNKFMDICLTLSDNQLVFLTWFNHRTNIHPNGYLMDHVIFGPIDLLYDYRKPIQLEGDNRCSEIFLQEEYFGKKNLSCDDVKNEVKLCFKQIMDNNIKLYATKLYNYLGYDKNNDFIDEYYKTGKCVL